ncbi:hypothetical protein D3C80_16950 [compost metagenome]
MRIPGAGDLYRVEVDCDHAGRSTAIMHLEEMQFGFELMIDYFTGHVRTTIMHLEEMQWFKTLGEVNSVV